MSLVQLRAPRGRLHRSGSGLKSRPSRLRLSTLSAVASGAVWRSQGLLCRVDRKVARRSPQHVIPCEPGELRSCPKAVAKSRELRRKLNRFWRSSTLLGRFRQVRPSSTRLVQLGSASCQFWAGLANISQASAKFGKLMSPKDQSCGHKLCPNIGPNEPRTAKLGQKPGKIRTRHRPDSTHVGRIWPELDEVGQNMAILADLETKLGSGSSS